MTASPAAQALPVRANGEIRHWHRRQLRRPPCFNDGRPWAPSSTWTRPDDGLVARPRPGLGRSRRRACASPLRLHPAQPGSGVTVVLDSRWRLLLPYGIRIHSGLEVRDSAHESSPPRTRVLPPPCRCLESCPLSWAARDLHRSATSGNRSTRHVSRRPPRSGRRTPAWSSDRQCS